MDLQLIASFIFLLVFLLLVIITQFLYSYFKLSSDKSRKFLHVTGGLLTLFFPLYLHSHWFALALCSLAFILLFFTYYKKVLPSVHETKRASIGSLIFPIPIYICFVTAEKSNNNLLLFFLPVSLLTIADTFAELGGKRWGHLSISFFNHQKTLIGSLFFAAAALILSIIFITMIFPVETTRAIVLIISITLLTTFAELISFKGMDNLTVPMSALLLLMINY